MTDVQPTSWEDLKWPWVRRDLLLYLGELATPDPRPLWKAEAARGLISGIDQVIHFLFDDRDFDESAIGYSLFGHAEVEAVSNVKRALDLLIKKLPRGDDHAYVDHPLWPAITRSAQAALEQLQLK